MSSTNWNYVTSRDRERTEFHDQEYGKADHSDHHMLAVLVRALTTIHIPMQHILNIMRDNEKK